MNRLQTAAGLSHTNGTAGSVDLESAASGIKRSQDLAGIGQSPGSAEDWEDRESRRTGVKRSCNECRQQKLRCDEDENSVSSCKRCRRRNLECRRDPNFKRVEKRNKNAEMERELADLRQKVASQESSPTARLDRVSPSPKPSQSPAGYGQYMGSMGSQEAVASLLDLKSGSRSSKDEPHQLKQIENVVLSDQRVQELNDL